MKPAGPQRRHFHVAARELLLDQPDRCPFLPALTLDGLAVTSGGQHYLVLTLGLDRVYVGPDDQTVRRRAQVLSLALHQGVAALDPTRADLVGWWITAAWEAAVDNLVEAIAAGDLDRL